MPCPFIIIAKLVCKEKKKNYNKSHVITSIKFVKILRWKAMKKEVIQIKEPKKKETKRKQSKASCRNTQCGRMSIWKVVCMTSKSKFE